MRKRSKRLVVGGLVLVGVGFGVGAIFVPWLAVGAGVSLLSAGGAARYIEEEQQQVQPAVSQRPPLRHYPHATVVEYDIEEIMEPRPSQAPSPSLLFVHQPSHRNHQINLSIDQQDIIPGMTNLDEKGRSPDKPAMV